MAIRMPAHVDHGGVPFAQHDDVAVLDRAVHCGNAPRVAFRRNHGAAGGGLDCLVPPGMVRVPMGVPDLADLPALVPGLTQVGIGIGRIDAGGFAAHRIVDEIAVVVGQAGELVNFEHGFLPPRLNTRFAGKARGRTCLLVFVWTNPASTGSAERGFGTSPFVLRRC